MIVFIFPLNLHTFYIPPITPFLNSSISFYSFITTFAINCFCWIFPEAIFCKSLSAKKGFVFTGQLLFEVFNLQLTSCCHIHWSMIFDDFLSPISPHFSFEILLFSAFNTLTFCVLLETVSRSCQALSASSSQHLRLPFPFAFFPSPSSSNLSQYWQWFRSLQQVEASNNLASGAPPMFYRVCQPLQVYYNISIKFFRSIIFSYHLFLYLLLCQESFGFYQQVSHWGLESPMIVSSSGPIIDLRCCLLFLRVHATSHWPNFHFWGS